MNKVPYTLRGILTKLKERSATTRGKESSQNNQPPFEEEEIKIKTPSVYLEEKEDIKLEHNLDSSEEKLLEDSDIEESATALSKLKPKGTNGGNEEE